MKIIYNLIFAILLLVLCVSCEEIVDIDLKSAQPKYVIDASISENMPCFVDLTLSQAFNNNDPYQRISGATIELTNDRGKREILEESLDEPGLYISEMLGEANHTYHLKVMVDDVVSEATATIPPIVPIQQAYIYEIKIGSSSWYSPSFIFQDPPELGNYYYTILYVNDVRMKTIYLNDDEFRNGKEIHRILFFDRNDNRDNDLKTGDMIRIEMQALDKGMYTYYLSLSSVAAGGATNPITNLSGNVLGCFKAYNPSYGDLVVSADAIYPEK